MGLTGPEILKQIDAGNIVIDPFVPENVGSDSVDLRLGPKLFRYSYSGRKRLPIFNAKTGQYEYVSVIDSRCPPDLEEYALLPEGGWLIEPGKLYIGDTMEYTETHGFKPMIDGRSSAGRLGIFLHITAGRGDNGFRGTWTLEITAVEPVIIYPGQRLCQVSYETLEGEPAVYGKVKGHPSSYGDKPQRGPTAAKPIL